MCTLLLAMVCTYSTLRLKNLIPHATKPTAESTGLDPIFFMHHSNIDFIFALYQAFKPDVALTDGQFMDGTFLVPPSMDDNYVGSFSDMSPFYKNPSRRKNYYKVISSFRLHSFLLNPYAAATSTPLKHIPHQTYSDPFPSFFFHPIPQPKGQGRQQLLQA